MGHQSRAIQQPQTVQEAQEIRGQSGGAIPRHQEENRMDAWRPPKKRAVDLIENALGVLALLGMGAGLLLIVIIAA